MKGSSNAPKILHSNKNLLDNWDFTNPVNQRGKASYQVQTNDPSRVYTIDRWALSNNSTKNKLTVSNGKITCSLSGQYSRLHQLVPVESSVIGGKTVTFSIITESYNASLELFLEFFEGDQITGYSDSIVLSNSNVENIVINGTTYKLFKTTMTLPSKKGVCHCHIINHNNTSTYSLSLIAAKLELGEVSTLKNDLLGVSYAEELKKCQRYFLKVNQLRVKGDIKANSMAIHPIQFPCTMRIAPVIYETKTKSIDSINQPFSVELQSNTSAVLVVANNVSYDASYDGGIEYAMFSADL